MLVTPGLQGLLEDEIAISVIGNHDILVAKMGIDREMAYITSLEGASEAMDGWLGRWLAGWAW
jgi:hypothetical protein